MSTRKMHLTLSLSGIFDISQDGTEDFRVNLHTSSFATHASMSDLNDLPEELSQALGRSGRALMLKWLVDHLKEREEGAPEGGLPKFNSPSGGAMA